MELVLALLRDPQVVTFILVIVIVVGLIAVGELWRQVRSNERISKYANAIKYARERAEELFLFIKTEGIDMGAVLVNGQTIDYNERSEQSEEIYGRKIDPRMLYVLDDIERNVFVKFGIKFEFDEIIPRAEAWYQKLRRSNNGLILNDKDIVAATEATATIELTVDQKRSEAQRRRREREAQAAAAVAPATVTE